jgi:hypothetical protein
MITVLQMAEGAAEKIGVKTAETALEPEDYQTILDELNDMGAEWADIGLTPAFVEVSNDTDIVNIDRSAVSAFKNNLAILIAPSFERIVTQALAAVAQSSLDRLRASTSYIGPVAYPDTLPTGSGNECSDSFLNDRFFDQNVTENF